MTKRTLQELNLMDDFLFFKILNHPEFGEEFSRELLRIIYGKKFGKLKVIPQKSYYGINTDKHGARLDVYIEEELDGDDSVEKATVFDVEPEQKDLSKNVKALSRRVRFYHAKIDAGSLKSGKDYRTLKNVIVIMIMPFDPFGYDHMVYTIRNACQEIPELPYDDGARTIFLYTKGKKGNPTKELEDFLHYMEDSYSENAKNDALKRIHKMVEAVKMDEEVSLEYMKIFEREQMLIEEGRQMAQAEIEEERRRAEAEKERAEIEKERAEVEKERADAERRRADAAEEELKKLKELLAQQRKV